MNKTIGMGIGFSFLAVMLFFYTFMAIWMHHIPQILVGSLLMSFCGMLGYVIISDELKTRGTNKKGN